MARHTHEIGLQLEHSQKLNRAAQQRIELVLDSTTESIWEWHVADEEIELRGRFCQRFGLPSGRVGLGVFRARVHPDDRERVLQAEQATLGHASPYSAEFRFADARGVYHWLLSRGRVLEQDPASGEVTLLAGTHVDIDDLKHIESDLRSATRDAEAANLAKARFISSMSHELRTPLTALTSRIQVLQRRHDRGEDLGAGLTNLRRDADMADVLNDLLIAAEGESFADGNADVATAAATAVAAMTTSEKRSEVSLAITVDQEVKAQLPEVTLVRILVALLDNAVQHSPARGTVSIRIARDARNVTVRVIDEGSGIEGISPEQVFERFARPRESGRPRSFGLGLSLVRDVARRAGGSIEVERSTASGTTFLLTLPAHP